MAATKLLLDTGPLIGYLNRADQYHKWAVERWASLPAPLWTCEAVLSEAIFNLQLEGMPLDAILYYLEIGIIRLDFSMEKNRADVSSLLRKYADQPMSLADACLVRMADLTERCQVFTTDKDFKIYRRKGRHVIPLIAPF
ncbi:MAG TPA: PIN domain-containing protein [Verrucomicrobiae bacterium]|jgi:predicted nucleic acid-binding protein|nr:PIN domain-containing protein [Verrucomicrobiae bacterium]